MNVFKYLIIFYMVSMSLYEWTINITLFCFRLHGFFSLPLTYPVLAGCLVCYPRAPGWQLLSVSAWHCTDHTPGSPWAPPWSAPSARRTSPTALWRPGSASITSTTSPAPCVGWASRTRVNRLSVEYLFWQIIFSGLVTYTKHDKLYCQDDYMKQFVPVCAKCDQYITQVWDHSSDLMSLIIKFCQECVKAMDKSWHPEHFQCVGCSVQFSGSLTYRESGEASCHNDSQMSPLITQGARPTVTSVTQRGFCRNVLDVTDR